MKMKAVVLVVMAVFLSWSGSGLAGSLDTLGVSSRGTAMGGAMIGIADGWEATYYNPSALALSRNSSSLSASMVNGNLTMNDNNSFAGGPSLKFGLNRRVLRNRIGLGFIVGLSPSSSTELSLDLGSLLGGGGSNWSWAMYEDAIPIILAAGIGIRVTDWLSFGISAQQKNGLISMSNFPLIADPIFLSLIGLGSNFTPTMVEGMGFSIGSEPDTDVSTGFNISIRPLKYISLGYSYKPETWTRYKIGLLIPGGGPGFLAEDLHYLIDMTVPGEVETTVYGGAAHIPIPWNDGLITIAYAHEIQNWDGFYPKSITYDWTSSQVFVEEWFTGKQPRDPGLKDVGFNRWGVEYEGSATPFLFWKLKNLANPRFAVRGGYYHWDTPQPDVNYIWQMAMVDSDADVYSFGLGFGYDRKKSKKAMEDPLSSPRLEFDFHFQQTDLEDRTYVMRPDEWGSVPLQKYFVRTHGSITQLGVQITWWK